MRASMEKAPGPNNVIAAHKTTMLILNATVIETRPIKTATMGVTNPSKRQAAAKRTTAAKPHAYAESSDDLICVTV